MCLGSSNELQPQERQRAPTPGSGCYLCYFEELRYPSHASEELLVDVQAFFTLGLLHVKVFLCIFFFGAGGGNNNWISNRDNFAWVAHIPARRYRLSDGADLKFSGDSRTNRRPYWIERKEIRGAERGGSSIKIPLKTVVHSFQLRGGD